MECYKIHDNWGFPCQVNIDRTEKRIHIKGPEDDENRYMLSFDYSEIFIGNSPHNEITSMSGGYGKKFNGNAILIRKAQDELCYLYVGSSVSEFKPKSPIKEFKSSIGNGGWPYPYAIDEQNNTYLLTENVTLLPKSEWEDSCAEPFSWYYDNRKKSQYYESFRMNSILKYK